MKKIFLVITFLLTSHYIFAQTFGFGIQGGVNMASINPTAPQSFGGNTQAHATFQFGATFDFKFKNNLSLEPGILLTGKGNTSVVVQNFISNGHLEPYYQTNSTNVTYIEIPVNVLYRHEVKLGALYVGAGPYLATAMWGSYRTQQDINTYYKNASTTSASFGSGSDQLKSMDFGINGLAGIVMNNGLKLGLNYGLGLSNITNSGGSSQNRVASLVVGYNFK